MHKHICALTCQYTRRDIAALVMVYHVATCLGGCIPTCGDMPRQVHQLHAYASDEVLNDLGVNDPILEIAKGLEQEALSDPYFVDRKLYPNVDFYSGIIYRAMGIPVEMFTVMFALGRLPGWIAQWKEMRLRKEPIGRPRQIYTGENYREFVEIKKR